MNGFSRSVNGRTWGSSQQKASVQKAAEASARARRRNRLVPSAIRRSPAVDGKAAPRATPNDSPVLAAQRKAELEQIVAMDPHGMAGAIARKQLDAKYGPSKPRTMDDVEADLNAAVARGDDAAVERLADELDALDAPQAPAAPAAPAVPPTFPPRPQGPRLGQRAPRPVKRAPKPAAKPAAAPTPAARPVSGPLQAGDKVRNADGMSGTVEKRLTSDKTNHMVKVRWDDGQTGWLRREGETRVTRDKAATPAPAKGVAGRPAQVKPGSTVAGILVGGKVHSAASLNTPDQFASVEEIDAAKDRYVTPDAYRRARSLASRNARPNGGPADTHTKRSQRIQGRIDTIEKRLADPKHDNPDARQNDKWAIADYKRQLAAALAAESPERKKTERTGNQISDAIGKIGRNENTDAPKTPADPRRVLADRTFGVNERGDKQLPPYGLTQGELDRNHSTPIETASGQHYVGRIGKNGEPDQWLSYDGKTRAEFDSSRKAAAASHRLAEARDGSYKFIPAGPGPKRTEAQKQIDQARANPGRPPSGSRKPVAASKPAADDGKPIVATTPGGKHVVTKGGKALSYDGKNPVEFDSAEAAKRASDRHGERNISSAKWLDDWSAKWVAVPRGAEPAGRTGESKRPGKPLAERMARHTDIPLIDSGTHVEYEGKTRRVMGYNPENGTVRIDDPDEARSPVVSVPAKQFLANAVPISRGPVPAQASKAERDALTIPKGERVKHAASTPTPAAKPAPARPSAPAAPQAADAPAKRGRGRPKLTPADVKARRDKYDTQEAYDAALKRAERRESGPAPRAPRPAAAPAAPEGPKRGRGRPKLTADDVKARRDKYATPQAYEAALARAQARETGAPVPRTRARKVAPTPAARGARADESATDATPEQRRRATAAAAGVKMPKRGTLDPSDEQAMDRMRAMLDAENDSNKADLAEQLSEQNGTRDELAMASRRYQSLNDGKKHPKHVDYSDKSAANGILDTLAWRDKQRRQGVNVEDDETDLNATRDRLQTNIGKLQEIIDSGGKVPAEFSDEDRARAEKIGSAETVAQAKKRIGQLKTRIKDEERRHAERVEAEQGKVNVAQASARTTAKPLGDIAAPAAKPGDSWNLRDKQSHLNAREREFRFEQAQKREQERAAMTAKPTARDVAAANTRLNEGRGNRGQLADDSATYERGTGKRHPNHVDDYGRADMERDNAGVTPALSQKEQAALAVRATRPGPRQDESANATPSDVALRAGMGPRIAQAQAEKKRRDDEWAAEKAAAVADYNARMVDGPGNASPRITAENADEVIAAQQARIDQTKAVALVKGSSRETRQAALQKIKAARTAIKQAEKIKADNAAPATPEAKQRRAVDALAEIRKGPLGATGRREPGNERDGFNSAQVIRPNKPAQVTKAQVAEIRAKGLPQDEEDRQINELRDRARDLNSSPIPNTTQTYTAADGTEKPYTQSYSRDAKAPLFAGDIKVGDVVAMRQERQSAYNSPGFHTTRHSKRYEVVGIGHDDRGIYYKVSQPGKEKKGKGGVRWRPSDLDTQFGIQPASSTPAPPPPEAPRVSMLRAPDANGITVAPSVANQAAEMQANVDEARRLREEFDNRPKSPEAARQAAADALRAQGPEAQAAAGPQTETQRAAARVEALQAEMISPTPRGTAREQQNYEDGLAQKLKMAQRAHREARAAEEKAVESDRLRRQRFTPEGRREMDDWTNRNSEIAQLATLRRNVKQISPESFAGKKAREDLDRMEARLALSPGEALPELPKPAGLVAPDQQEVKFDRDPPKYLARLKRVKVQLRGGKVVEGQITARTTGANFGDVYTVRVPKSRGAGQVDVDVDMNGGPDGHKILPPERKPRPKKAPAPTVNTPLAPAETPAASPQVDEAPQSEAVRQAAARVADVEARMAEPDTRKDAKRRQQRRDVLRIELKAARQDLETARNAPVDVDAERKATAAAALASTGPQAKAARKPRRTLDDVEAEMTAAVEAGDDARVDALADEMDDIERRQKATQQRAKSAEVKKAEHMGRLLDDGADADDAEAEAYGVSVERIRKRNFMRDARRDGHDGKSFDELVAWKHHELVQQAYRDAEDATNGVMVKKRYAGNVDPRKLWEVNETTARKWMTEEMANWFDEHGRVTRAGIRSAILRGSGNYFGDASQIRDFLA